MFVYMFLPTNFELGGRFPFNLSWTSCQWRPMHYLISLTIPTWPPWHPLRQ